MTTNPPRLPVTPLPGLRPDSLGNYLASLGLLRLLARKWPSVRIAWRDQVLHVVGGPTNLDELLDELGCVAERGAWTTYERGWATAQKKSGALAGKTQTRPASGVPLALWQAKAGEDVLELFAAHVVPNASGRSFNPLLGDGGMKGRRVFSDGWRAALDALGPPSPKKAGKNETVAKSAAREAASRKIADDEKRRKQDELEAVLLGNPLTWLLAALNAGAWFSTALKLYNTGQTANRKEPLSPWLMALACEGLSLLAGGASRRLGARSGRAKGAFPFVTDAAAPLERGEAGRDSGEFWAALWERPMTLPEVRALFSRGRAEIGGRGVLTPTAFAVAILRRGVDAGVAEFLRFSLGRTTSAKTFEPRLEGRFTLEPTVDVRQSPTATPTVLERLLGLVNGLPSDKAGQRWRFLGLRGPVEAAMLHLAAASGDAEAAISLLDSVVRALDRVDRNKSFRQRPVSWQPLPLEYLPSLFVDDTPGVEARLAIALVGAFPPTRPFALYRFGVEEKIGRFVHTERSPLRWVWGPGPLPHVLSRVLMRRTLDWEAERKAGDRAFEPVRLGAPAAAAHVGQWLDGAVDETLLASWLARLALFDWCTVPNVVRRIARGSEPADADASLCLMGMIQPLFDTRPVLAPGRSPKNLLPPESGARTPGAARALAGLVRSGQIDAAVRLTMSRYAMAGAPLVRTNVPWRTADPDRLLSAILFPIADSERTALIQRWLRPRRLKGDEAHD